MAAIDETTAALRVKDLDGQEHELRALWRDRPALLVFVRHFG